MTSTVKVPSTLVPIDVSGQPFSRMASFRRSLIHGDFFIRRKKKKDKRRNTVTEGDTKELKDVLHNFINEERQKGVVPAHLDIKRESLQNSKLPDQTVTKNPIIVVEKNNNLSEVNACTITNSKICSKSDAVSETKNTVSAPKNENCKVDLKNHFKSDIKSSVSTKKKSKSHIPISTNSAAMSVAVEMRQSNDAECGNEITERLEDHSSSGNWSYSSDLNSSDSENKTGSDSTKAESLEFDRDVSLASSEGINKDGLKETMANSDSSSVKLEDESRETDASSCTSSDNNPTCDDVTSSIISNESDAFFLSSDESDEDSSDLICRNNYGSSVSLSTASDGSLNSLLSQTATEMASSTGTLTSIGIERLPTPPPPPPAMIAAIPKDEIALPPPPPAMIAAIRKHEIAPSPPPPAMNAAIPKDEIAKKTDCKSLPIQTCKSDKQKSSQKQNSTKLQQSKKPKSPPPKCLRPPTPAHKIDATKVSSDNSKKLFTNLVNIKPKSKEGNKIKTPENVMQNRSFINMYGSSSPKNIKQFPTFIKDSTSPVADKEPRNYMQSFSAYQPQKEVEIQPEKISDIVNKEVKEKASFNPPPIVAKTVDVNTFESNRVEVPLKYVQKVIVTPIQRPGINEHTEAIVRCKKSLFNDTNNQHQNNVKNNNILLKTNTIYSSNARKSEIPGSESIRPSRPMTLQPEKPKSAARVLLDPDGKVIHCTNSLERQIYHQTPREGYVNNHCIRTGDTHLSSNRQTITNNGAYVNQNPCLQAGTHQISTPNRNYQFHSLRNNETYRSGNAASTVRYRMDTPGVHTMNSPGVHAMNSPGVQQYRGYVTSMSPQNQSPLLPSQTMTPKSNYFQAGVLNTFKPPYQDKSTHDVRYVPRNTPESAVPGTHVIIPNPNISGLPVNETMLTQRNVKLHSKHMERLNTSQVSSDDMDSSRDSFTSFRSPKSPMSAEDSRSQSTMSTEDLFAVIHSCKKRMNIKTDSDISIASSSRSSSPSFIRPASSKGTLVETGFLSPRTPSSFDMMGDRRSWADFRPSSAGSERKSLASDRLGPTKPTSMHDFKMLLLQTRSNSQILGPRKSAVEMLKVAGPTQGGSNNNTQRNSTPMNLSPRNSLPLSVPNSPSSDFYFCNGHSTVPFKRGNRMRSSLQSRYTMYPPIFEEDSENARDIIQNNSVTNNEVNKNTQSLQNKDKLCGNTIQKNVWI